MQSQDISQRTLSFRYRISYEDLEFNIYSLSSIITATQSRYPEISTQRLGPTWTLDLKR